MAMLCFGGVCIPYSALLFPLFYVLRWILQRLVGTGLLPESLERKVLQFVQPATAAAAANASNNNNNNNNNRSTRRSGSRGKLQKSTSSTSTTPVEEEEEIETMISIESEEQFEELIEKNKFVICKFTADWCVPCKQIQPVYDSIAQEKSKTSDGGVAFCVIDVDEMDSIAAQYNVAVMPTFLVLLNKSVIGTHRGINGLEEFVQRNLY